MKKLIKKLVLKYLEKHTSKEFTQMDNRIYDIEVKLGIQKPEHDAGSKYAGDMSVKDAEHLKDAKEPHFLELPNIWKVWFNEDQKHLVDYFLKWKNPLHSKQGFLLKDENGDYSVASSKNGSKDYTEISFSDFERLVLKKEEVAKIEDLETGKWYKQGKSFAGVKQYLIYVVKKDDLGVEGYGICDGIWFNNGNSYCSDLIQASNKEVETALLNEAKRRGFKEGIKIKSFNNNEHTLNHSKMAINPEFYNGNTDHFGIRMGGACIYANGIWAEILDLPKGVQEIDFSVPGQLLSDVDGYIVFTSGLHNNLHFEATVIQGPLSVGNYHTLLNKSEFIVFNGTMGLKN